MRNRGASTVAVVVLVVTIVACVGFVVYWATRSGPSVTAADVTQRYLCAAPGCGFSQEMGVKEAARLPEGPAFDGGGEELRKCPKCGKFSFDTLSKCPKCQKEFVDTGKGCPNCGKAE